MLLFALFLSLSPPFLQLLLGCVICLCIMLEQKPKVSIFSFFFFVFVFKVLRPLPPHSDIDIQIINILLLALVLFVFCKGISYNHDVRKVVLLNSNNSSGIFISFKKCMLLYSHTFKRHTAKRKCRYTEAKFDTTTVHLGQLLSITTSQVSHPLSTHNNNSILLFLHFPLCCKTTVISSEPTLSKNMKCTQHNITPRLMSFYTEVQAFLKLHFVIFSLESQKH